MSNNTQQLVSAVSDTLGLVTSSLTLAITLGAGTVKLAKHAVETAPEVGAAIATLPFAAYKGGLVENGMDEADAEAKAYKYVEQKLAVTIKEAGEATGAGMAAMFGAVMADDNNANTEEVSK